MADSVTYRVNNKPAARSICDLREAVGWERNEEDYPAALQRYDTTVSAYDDSGILIGWCAAITDGVRHGFLVDVIVHPKWRRQGVGSSLVGAAVDDLRSRRITLIHADFSEEYAPFYEQYGFHIGAGGFLEI